MIKVKVYIASKDHVEVIEIDEVGLETHEIDSIIEDRVQELVDEVTDIDWEICDDT